MLRKLLAALAILGCSFSAGHARLLGDTMTCTDLFGFGCTPSQLTISGINEFNGVGVPLRFIFDDLGLSILGDADLGQGFVFAFNDITDPIVSATYQVGSTALNVDQNDLSVVNGILTVNLDGASIHGIQFVSILITTRQDLPTTLDEPGCTASLAFALVVGGLLMRRRALRKRDAVLSRPG